MSAPTVRTHFDDRGVSRQLVELWVPHLDVDAVWLVDGELPDEEMARDVVPFVQLSALDIAAVAMEARVEPSRVIAVFGSLDALQTAASLGYSAARVVIHHLRPSGDVQRIAPEVEINEPVLDQLAALESAGFTFEIQPTPHVTARPWSAIAQRNIAGR